ncbi:MAG: ABC transporter permease, partial [Muribaculaceae bacterium]|nr:ABC transporter permease [Muribaculaceae bacterium]
MKNDNTTRRHCAPVQWFIDMARVFARQWWLTGRDMGALIFFLALPFAYPVVYTLIYNPEIVTRMPVAVVDNSRTEPSRQLVRTISASPAVDIYEYCPNLTEAKELFAENKVFAIVEIPEDYARCLGRGEQATVPVYMEMSLLLRYRAMLSALTDLQLKVASDVTATRLETMGAEALGLSGGMPFNQGNNFLGDPNQGFASFVMPGVFMLIVQQSMLLGICLLMGTSRERARRNGGIDPLSVQASPTARLLGTAMMCVVLYIPALLYLLKVMPAMFSLPEAGDFWQEMLFMLPYLLASAMFAQFVGGLCTERESGFLVVVFTSLIFLFLSGLTWPRYAMSPFWKTISDMIPATWGVEGFIRMNSNGASLADISVPFHWMWILTAGYFLLAWAILRLTRPRT